MFVVSGSYGWMLNASPDVYELNTRTGGRVRREAVSVF